MFTPMKLHSFVRGAAVACALLTSMALVRADDSKDPEQKTHSRQFVDDKSFVTSAAICSSQEVRLGTLASEKASTDSVKRFATQIVTDHNGMRQELAKIAQAEGYQLPSTEVTSAANPAKPTGPEAKETDPSKGKASELSKEDSYQVSQYQKTFQNLQGLSGFQFDEAFVKFIQKNHKKAIEVFEQAAASAKSPAVQQFAASKVPVLKQHLATADLLSKELGAKTLTNR
jgi:putative membrane protein